jgi:hypothetical protein
MPWPEARRSGVRRLNDRSAYDSRADTLAHINRVRDHIEVFVASMLARGRVHDASKLEASEKATFDQIIPLLEGLAYGSPEYEAVVERARPALEHHYRRNSHHPEHHGPAGVAAMDLFDVVEMVCDWMAAAERNPDDGVKLDYNVRLFGIEPQLASIIGNTLARWPRSASRDAAGEAVASTGPDA